MSDDLVDAIRSLCQATSRVLSVYDTSRDPCELDYLIYQVDKLYRIVKYLNLYTDSTIEVLSTSLGLLLQIQDQEQQEHDVSSGQYAYVPNVLNTSRRGRPSLDVSSEQIEYLLNIGFSCTNIASVIGVSLSTIRRRMTQSGLSVRALYSTISDNHLDILASKIQEHFPNCGYRMMYAHLLQEGHRVPHHRVRETLRRIDPEGVAVRWASTVRRRTYSVPSPLSLWHIDGNHKLIRWRLVIHGGVDGYSRIPVFLFCSNNNKASTVLQLFKNALYTYGLPSRVRCDAGGENVEVSMFMLSHPKRGPGRGSVIVGKSVHNQRVERMWRDVYQGVLGLYRDLFTFMESINILDPNDDIHIFCLHYVFIARINRHLSYWKNSWIKHPMRSEHNLTPQQLWTAGLQRIAGSQSMIAKEVFEDFNDEQASGFGIDWEEPTSGLQDAVHVHVPPTDSPISEVDYLQLETTIDPLSESNHFGMDLYEKTLTVVASLI